MSEQEERRAALAALTGGEGFTPVSPPILLRATPYFDLAGEEFGRRMLLTSGNDGEEYCLRPDFTLPIAIGYLDGGAAGLAASFGYLGPVFRQRADGPAEFDQAGIELIAQPDPDEALDRVFGFALSATGIYDLVPSVTLGSVELFEALLANVDMPDVWRPRIRHRFGHPEAMDRLLFRLADPHAGGTGSLPWKREELVSVITDQMVAAGMSLTGSRSPEEVAERYFEKQQLAAARVPSETITLLRAYLALSGPVRPTIEKVEKLAGDQGIDIAAPLARLLTHVDALEKAAGAGKITFKAGFSPRLDYYTGLVFELSNGDRTLASGGEYGRLLQRLGATDEIAASGCSVWVDRLEAEAWA